MNRAMFASATGMAAQQKNLDILADNLANSDVAGFKAATAAFTDVRADPQTGLGTQIVGTHANFSQGKLMKSEGPFDVAIDGSGFFVVQKDGKTAYTRDGEFARAADGTMRNAQGWKLNGVRIPQDAIRTDVGTDGRVYVDTDAHKHVAIGRIGLASFPSPEALRPLGATIFAATPQSGSAHSLHARGDGGPAVRFGMLEKSNVSIVEAMMQIMQAQRAYEANSKGVQAADEMLRIANNLHRS